MQEGESLMNDYNLRKIRKCYEEYCHVFGKQTTEFWKGWLAGTSFMNKKEIDNYLEEIYNDIDQEKYIKKEGGLK